LRRLYWQLPGTQAVATSAWAVDHRFHVRRLFRHVDGLPCSFHYLLGDCFLEVARGPSR
jgi:hypothetical protein